MHTWSVGSVEGNFHPLHRHFGSVRLCRLARAHIGVRRSEHKTIAMVGIVIEPEPEAEPICGYDIITKPDPQPEPGLTITMFKYNAADIPANGGTIELCSGKVLFRLDGDSSSSSSSSVWHGHYDFSDDLDMVCITFDPFGRA